MNKRKRIPKHQHFFQALFSNLKYGENYFTQHDTLKQIQFGFVRGRKQISPF